MMRSRRRKKRRRTRTRGVVRRLDVGYCAYQCIFIYIDKHVDSDCIQISKREGGGGEGVSLCY